METKWLNIQSFQRNQSLLDAINTVLIVLKLRLEGVQDPFGDKNYVQAKEIILDFLTNLDKLLKTKSNSTVYTLTGIDNRFGKLVRSFAEAKTKRSKYKSILFQESPTKVAELLRRDDSKQEGDLVKALSELRTLVENHASLDNREIIGEI